MKPAQLAQLVFVVLAAAGVYLFVSAAKEGEQRRLCTPICAMRPNYAARNRRAPDFELPTVGGGKVTLSEHRGKVVVLNFWTKSCRPCLEEMPSLAQFAEVVKGRKDLAVLTISTDETLDDVRATLKSILGGKVPFVTAHDPESEVVMGKYGTKLYPETWLIDGKGIIRARVDGARNWSNPLALELVEGLRGPLTCSQLVRPDESGYEFHLGRPVGELAGVCSDLGV